MYYTQKSRSSVVIDPAKCHSNTLIHGRVAWLLVPESKVRMPVYWDIFEKRFVSALEFKARRAIRAAANRERHALVPFGAQRRIARRKEQGMPLPPPLSGWAQA
jgi:hypothetical protein